MNKFKRFGAKELCQYPELYQEPWQLSHKDNWIISDWIEQRNKGGGKKFLSFAVFQKGLTLTAELKMINRIVTSNQSSNEMAMEGKCFLICYFFNTSVRQNFTSETDFP